jgi:signal transduction histidine kinase
VGLPYLPIALLGPARSVAVPLACLLPALALAGLAHRVRREDAENAATRDAAQSTLVEHTARGERARIARELHDVVAHHISMINVQAENARLTIAGMPAAGAQRLSAISDTARAALTEMRRLLGVLREDTRGEVDDRHPQPGLRELADLLDAARDATGAGTRLILRGAPVPLDPGVQLAAYRIVQEALTNARRHAPGAAVDVELHYTGGALRLVVRDNGPGLAAPPRAGAHGLLGMRERAAAVGGALRSGPASTGGFLIEAVLPTATTEPA